MIYLAAMIGEESAKHWHDRNKFASNSTNSYSEIRGLVGPPQETIIAGFIKGSKDEIHVRITEIQNLRTNGKYGNSRKERS